MLSRGTGATLGTAQAVPHVARGGFGLWCQVAGQELVKVAGDQLLVLLCPPVQSACHFALSPRTRPGVKEAWGVHLAALLWLP